jgi:restriction system protein
MEILLHPIVIGLGLSLFAGLVASFALGLWRADRNEARAGIAALCRLKWRDYAHIVEDLLRDRGYTRGGEERRPGEGGFDLMMTRGTSRYLIECKNGAAQRVTAAAVRDLAALVEHEGAEGAVIATTGQVDAEAELLAASRRVDIIAGDELWRQVRPWVPHDVRAEAEAQARASYTRRMGLSLALAVLAGVLGASFAPASGPDAPPATSRTPPAREPALAPSPTATPSALGIPAAMPDATLTDEQLAARRASVALELRGNPTLHNVVWATKSTLVMTLHPGETELPDRLFDEACRTLVQYEELRYTRVQIEGAAPAAGAAPNVRWRQCR